MSGHRGPLQSSTGLISSSSRCYSPPFPRLLLLSSGYRATRLTANREGLPRETEKQEGGGGRKKSHFTVSGQDKCFQKPLSAFCELDI